MKKLIIALSLILSLTSCTELLKFLEAGSTLNTISESEAVSGLKNALELGVTNGTDFLGETDGFLKNTAYKILMPAEVQNVVSDIRSNPITNTLAGPFLDKVEVAMNRGAERAMAEAKPIFVNAIKSMTIRDAINIVKGGEGAATNYLISATSDQLRVKFRPVIKESLDQVNINEPWTKVSTAYNMVTGKSVQTDLNDYVTEKAMDALFSQIKEEENKIRKDPMARVTPILKKVFNYADQYK